MTQPPDDRRPSPLDPAEAPSTGPLEPPSLEPPGPPSTEPPTVAWTPPDGAPSPAPLVPPDTAGTPPPQSPIISASPTPEVAWAPPDSRRPEIAPGLVLSDTGSRFVAFVLDSLIVGLISGILSGVLGLRSIAPVVLPGGELDVNAMFGGVGASVLGVAVGGVYFVLSWTGGRRATLGQRLFRIQVGNAFDGASLTLEQAIRRWLGLGEFLGLFVFAPAIAATASTIQLFWVLALLLSTVISPTKQGFHDRFANTAVVRPATAGSGAAMTCLVIVVALALIGIAGIIGLLFVGGQMSSILSAVGESI